MYTDTVVCSSLTVSKYNCWKDLGGGPIPWDPWVQKLFCFRSVEVLNSAFGTCGHKTRKDRPKSWTKGKRILETMVLEWSCDVLLFCPKAPLIPCQGESAPGNTTVMSSQTSKTAVFVRCVLPIVAVMTEGQKMQDSFLSSIALRSLFTARHTGSIFPWEGHSLWSEWRGFLKMPVGNRTKTSKYIQGKMLRSPAGIFKRPENNQESGRWSCGNFAWKVPGVKRSSVFLTLKVICITLPSVLLMVLNIWRHMNVKRPSVIF